jgi:hypothetical protein
MKKLSFLAAICLAALTIRAQNIKVEWSEKYKYEKEYITTVKSPVKDGFVKISYTHVSERLSELAKGLVITHYDKRMQFISEKEIPLDERNLMLTNMICMKNNFYLISVKNRKSDDETDINLTTIDIVNDKIGPTKVMINYPIGSGGFLKLPKFVYSKDSARVLVYVNYIKNNRENQHFADFVIDEKGEKVWEKKFDIPVPGLASLFFDTPKYVFDQAIDNDGVVYLLFLPTVGEAAKSSKYRLVSIDSKGDMTHTDLDLSTKVFCDAGITVNEKGNIVFCGFFKEKEKGNITGYGIYALDKKNMQTITSKETNFEPWLIEKIAEDKQGKNRGNNAGISDNFRIKSIVTKRNGDVDFIAEYWEMLQSGPTSVFFNEGDLLVLEYKASGDISCIRVPKFQTSENANFFGSYYAWENKNKLYLLYNDCMENLQSEDKLVTFDFHVTHLSNLRLVVTVINEKGKVSRKSVLDFDEAGLAPRPRRSGRVSPDQVSLFGSKLKYLSRPVEAIGILTSN